MYGARRRRRPRRSNCINCSVTGNDARRLEFHSKLGQLPGISGRRFASILQRNVAPLLACILCQRAPFVQRASRL